MVVPYAVTQLTERPTKLPGFLILSPHTPPSQDDLRTFIPKHTKCEGLSIMSSRSFACETNKRSWNWRKYFSRVILVNCQTSQNIPLITRESRPTSQRWCVANLRSKTLSFSPFLGCWVYSLNQPQPLYSTVKTGGQPSPLLAMPEC